MTATAQAINVDQAMLFLSSIEDGKSGVQLEQFFHPDARQIEYPSILRPAGGDRDLQGILTASKQNAGMMAKQKFEVLNTLASGDWVALQLTWTAILAQPLRNLAAGDVIRAHVAMFLTFRDGRVIRQESYDCYEPLAAG